MPLWFHVEVPDEPFCFGIEHMFDSITPLGRKTPPNLLETMCITLKRANTNYKTTARQADKGAG